MTGSCPGVLVSLMHLRSNKMENVSKSALPGHLPLEVSQSMRLTRVPLFPRGSRARPEVGACPSRTPGCRPLRGGRGRSLA